MSEAERGMQRFLSQSAHSSDSLRELRGGFPVEIPLPFAAAFRKERRFVLVQSARVPFTVCVMSTPL